MNTGDWMLLAQRAYTDVRAVGFKETPRKAAKFGAMGSTVRAVKP